LRVCRFKAVKMSRSFRRAVLELLDAMDGDRLIEDMCRHRSYWVWVGEFLHPHEYATRYPKAARAFQVVRKKAPDGTPAPDFETWHAKLEKSINLKDADATLKVLTERPGELARRLDHLLRLTDNEAVRSRVVAAFDAKVTAFATPVLLTLAAHLPKRQATTGVRVYWP